MFESLDRVQGVIRRALTPLHACVQKELLGENDWDYPWFEWRKTVVKIRSNCVLYVFFSPALQKSSNLKIESIQKLRRLLRGANVAEMRYFHDWIHQLPIFCLQLTNNVSGIWNYNRMCKYLVRRMEGLSFYFRKKHGKIITNNHKKFHWIHPSPLMEKVSI